MNPSLALASALTVWGLSLPAFGQSAAPRACVNKAAASSAPADKSPDAPFDAATETLEEAFWTRAKAAGVKLDLGACRLIAIDGHALTRREVEALRVKSALNDPKPQEKDTKKIAAVRAALDGAGPADLDAKQRFDGAVPGRVGPTEISGGAAAVGAWVPPEARFSATLNADIRAKYSQEEAGRTLLTHFTAADGTVRLPGVMLADLGGGGELAVYDRRSGYIKLDKTAAATAIVASVPETQRAALGRALADPAKLSAYLVDHPEARAALLDQQAGTFFHETFHAWQARRDPKIDAVEEKDPVEWEREAFREELHYFHQRVMRDPTLADRSQDMEMYKKLLGGYPEFKEYTTELYQNSVGSSDFPTVEKLLAKRAAAGRSGAAGSLDALNRVDADYRQREADFASKTLPAMQAEAYPLLIARQMAAGRPVEALALACAAPDDVRRDLGPKAFAAVENFLKSDPAQALDARLDAWDAYVAYVGKSTGSNVLPVEVYLKYARDRREAVEERLLQAARASGKGERKDAIDWARFYAAGLADNSALLKRIEAAGQTASR